MNLCIGEGKVIASMLVQYDDDRRRRGRRLSMLFQYDDDRRRRGQRLLWKRLGARLRMIYHDGLTGVRRTSCRRSKWHPRAKTH